MIPLIKTKFAEAFREGDNLDWFPIAHPKNTGADGNFIGR